MRRETDILDLISGIISSILKNNDPSSFPEKLTQLFGGIYKPRWAAWFPYEEAGDRLFCTSLWSTRGSSREDYEDIPYLILEDLPFLKAKCLIGETFVIDRKELPPEERQLKYVLKRLKTDHAVVTPVLRESHFVGFFAVDPGSHREIERDRGRRGMSLLGNILSVILRHEETVNEFEKLEHQLHETLNALNVYPYSFDFTRGKIDNLDFWCEMTGFPREELGLRILGIPASFFPKEDFERLLLMIRKLHFGELEDFYEDFRIRTAEKGYRWFRCIVKVTSRKEKGIPSGIIGLIYDIDKRKKLELETARQTKMLLDREKRLSHMAMNSSDILIEMDREGQLLYVNKRFTEITGIAPGPSLDFSQVIHPGDNLPRFLEACRNEKSPDAPHDQLRLKTTKYGYRWYEWSVTPLVGEDVPKGFIATGRDITAQRTREERQEYQLTHDVLTGLYNNHFVADRVAGRIDDNCEIGIVCLYINVDNFREINEIYGHALADEYLIQLGNKLEDICRSTSVAARISGDEFVILWDDDYEDEQFEDYLGEPLARLNGTPLVCSHISIPLSFTTGYALYPEDADQAEQIIPFAETAMIQAKMEARGSIKRFDRDLYLRNLYKREILTDVKMADVEKEFELYYQPIVNLKNSDEFLMEALLRWNHPTKGFLMPGRFIDALEESGQIAEIGIALFRQVLVRIREWSALTEKRVAVSYNLSAASLRRQGEAAAMVEMMGEYGISHDQVHMEITETLALNNDSVVVQNLKIFRDSHIKIALDDFGMHYSTLSLLDKVEFDILKVDIYFTRNIDKPIPHSVVKMIREIVDVNDKECIVEGVETEEQLRKMTDLGFFRIQGYYFHKPLDSPAIADLLKGTT